MKKNQLSRITVYNIKGGVGKTRIALNLAMELDFGVITNDEYSIVQKVLPSSRCKIIKTNEPLPKYSAHIPIIYDLGGHQDARAVQALKQSQVVITPILPEKGDLQISLDFLEEIKRYNQNIIIIVNRANDTEFRNVQKVCQEHHPLFPVFQLKKSRVMSLLVERRKTIKKIAKNDKLHGRHYIKVADQFDLIIWYILINFNNGSLH